MTVLYNNILETIGNTPVVRINKLAPEGVNIDEHLARPGEFGINVILFADTDLLTDRLWVQKQPFLGQNLVSELLAEKRPSFLTNDNFDPAEFGVEFDLFLARSIWTHASREQI